MSSSSSAISFISLLFLASNLIIVTSVESKSESSESMIKKACSNFLPSYTKSCYKILRSHPDIISSTNFLNLSVAIMQHGISNATNTQNRIEKLFRGPTFGHNSGANSKGALQECRYSFRRVLSSFNSAFSEVKMGDYITSTYDLAIGSSDDIRACEKNLASGRVKDALISYGVNAVPIYGLSASHALDNI